METNISKIPGSKVYPQNLSEFNPVNKTALWVFALAGLYIIVCTYALLFHEMLLFLHSFIGSTHDPNGQDPEKGFFIALANSGQFFNQVKSFFFIVLGIVFLIWKYRAYKNLHSLNAGELEYSPRWAVLGYFVPIANFVIPFKIMREIWQGSNPQHADKVSWINSSVSFLVPLWWVLFWVQALLSYGAHYFYDVETYPVDGIYIANLLFPVHFIISSVAAITLIILVRVITDRQWVKHERLLSERGITRIQLLEDKLERDSKFPKIDKWWVSVIAYAFAVTIFLTNTGPQKVNGRIRMPNEWSPAYVRVKVYDYNDNFLTYADTDTNGIFRIDDVKPGRYHFYFIDVLSDDEVYYNDTLLNVGRTNHVLSIMLDKTIPVDSTTPLKYFEYDADIALYDLKHGNTFLLSCGVQMTPEQEYFSEKFDSLKAYYSFETIDLGDIAYSYTGRMMEAYNAPVEKYLAGIHGEDWKERYNARVDSLTKQIELIELPDWEEFQEYIGDKYNIKEGQGKVMFIISNEGIVTDILVTKSSIPDLRDIINNEKHRLKFEPFQGDENKYQFFTFKYGKEQNEE